MRLSSKITTLILAGLFVFSGACDDTSKDEEKSEESSTKEQESSDEESSDSSSNVPFKATGTVAVIDGDEVTADEFNQVIEKQFSNAPMPLPKSRAKQMKPKILKSMVDKKLIEREIEKAGVEVTEKEVDEEFEKFKENMPDDQAMERFLQSRNLTKDELRDKMKKDLGLRKLLREREDIEISDEEAKKYYEDNPEKYEEDEQVKASHILIKTPDDASDEEVEKARKKAEEVAKKAKKEGTDFSKLAEEESEGPSAEKGGDLGFFTRDRMVEAFTDKAFSMENGEISDPVKTEFGFHVIKRFDYKDASKKDFEEAKGDIVEQLEREKFRKGLDKFIQKLREDAEVEENPDNIEVTAKEGGGGMGGMLGGHGKKGGAPPALKKKIQKKLKQRQQQRQKESGGGAEGKGKGGNLKLKKPESLKKDE